MWSFFLNIGNAATSSSFYNHQMVDDPEGESKKGWEVAALMDIIGEG